MRIGFLYNHDQIHQVAHSLPIALALAKSGIDAEIVIATTSARLTSEVRRLMGTNCPAVKLVEIGLRSRTSRIASALLGKLVPAAKLLVYRDNLEFFRSLTALIVTERTSLILKTRYGLGDLMMILSDHGAGDRAIGFGATTARFDHVLAAGQKISDRLIAEAGVKPERVTITGYPKFDMAPAKPSATLFADGARPVVLYNPHVSPHLSSWYKYGREVLDFFLDNPDYNLIFAPHIMLFQRRAAMTIDKLSVGIPGKLDPKYAGAPNIHVDLGSVALTDMSYTNLADVYIGDVSSQVYEFLKTPRPCVFLNAHKIQYCGDPNYAHWQAGPVIETVTELGQALERASAGHEQLYRPIQKSLFAYTFDLTDVPSSIRAARKIADIVGREPVLQGKNDTRSLA